MTSAFGQTKDSKSDAIALAHRLRDSMNIAKYDQWNENNVFIERRHDDASVLRSKELLRDTLELSAFLENDFDSARKSELESLSPNEVLDYLYAVDLNGDGRRDMVYEGPTNGEPSAVDLYLNTGGGYLKVFTGYQLFSAVDFIGGKLNSFTLINPGCCADPTVLEHRYLVDHDKGEMKFRLQHTTGYEDQTEKPSRMYESQTEFVVTQNTSKLRTTCYQFDGVENGGGALIYGNLLAIYKRGAKGRLLGTKKRGGTNWVYVEMKPSDVAILNGSSFADQPTHIRGWLRKADTDIK